MSRQQIQCPNCGGKIQTLGGDAMFCLACDWDNVQEIPSGVSFTAGVDFIDASHPNNQGNRILIKSILRK